MRRLKTLLLLTTVMVLSSLPIGCRDEGDPEYWLDQMYDRPWREKSLKVLNDIFNRAMQDNNSDFTSPKVKEVTDLMLPKLVKGFNDFTRDKFNRKEIIKLLAQMRDERAAPVFMQGLKLKETSDAMMFEVSANALGRLAYEAAIPELLTAHKEITAARDRRPGAPFTPSENEIEQAIISASSRIVNKKPATPHKGPVVEMLCTIAETSDEFQELRLNMKALQGLGRIGDASAVPTLIKGIAMKGKRQPIGLGKIAFAALQQIHDRDAVVDAIIAFSNQKDESFNTYYKRERTIDPLMKNPNWYRQEAVSFIGVLNYSSPKVIAFLESELNHLTPDADDTKSEKIEGLPVAFYADGWAMVRRNWAAVSLSLLAHKPILKVIKSRMSGKKKPDPEEAVGYVQAMGNLQYPKESCNVLLKTAKAGDDSMRDKAYYTASMMCGKAFTKAVTASHDKINCKKILKQRYPRGYDEEEEKQTLNECNIMKKRLLNYKANFEFGEQCGDDIDCYIKVVDAKTDPHKERAIFSLYRMARDNPAVQDKVVAALSKNLGNPSKTAMKASVRVLDQLTPKGNENLVKRIQEVYREIQLTYKAEARMLESFIGRVRNRAR
jgi:hypothetical protein